MPFTIHRGKPQDRVIVMGGAKVQPPPIENKQGRKKMADEKKMGHETGVKKISQEPANKQGPVGDTNQQPPANPPSEDIKVGGDEEKANG